MSESKAVTPAAPTVVATPLHKVGSLQEAFDHPDFVKRLTQSLPANIITPERMLRVCIQAVQRTPMLAKVPVMQLIGGFLTCGLVGLEPNTHLQQVHMIPFQKWKNINGKWEVVGVDLNLIFGYPGLSTLVWRSGLVASMHADVAWKGDEFSFEYGTNHHLRHRPTGQHDEEKETPAWAYMHASIKGGGDNFEVMPWADVMKIRNGSQGYQAALKARERAKGGLPPAWTEAPWVKHSVAMARKTAFRAGQKWLPKSVEVSAAIQLDTLQDRKTANFSDIVIDQDTFLQDGVRPLEDPDDRAPDPRFGDRRPGQTIDHEDNGGGTSEGTGTNDGGTTTGPGNARTNGGASGGQRGPQADAPTGGTSQASGAGGPPPGHPAADDPPVDDGAQNTATGDGGENQDAVGETEFFISDEFGEPLPDDAGYATTAIDFMRKYRAGWEATKNRPAMVENNADALAQAMEDPAAAEFYNNHDWTEAPATNTKAPAADKPKEASAFRWPLELPKKGGRPDLVAAVAVFRAEVAKIPDADTLQAFITAHRDVIGRLPGVSKANVNTAISQRAGELGLELEDPDKSWLRGVLLDVAKITSEGAIRAHLDSGAIGTKIARLKTEKPELFEWMKVEVEAHLARVRG